MSEEALEVWNSDHKGSVLFIPTHDQLEQIDLSFAVLPLHLQQGNYDDFSRGKNIKPPPSWKKREDNEMPSLHNLFLAPGI